MKVIKVIKSRWELFQAGPTKEKVAACLQSRDPAGDEDAPNFVKVVDHTSRPKPKPYVFHQGDKVVLVPLARGSHGVCGAPYPQPGVILKVCKSGKYQVLLQGIPSAAPVKRKNHRVTVDGSVLIPPARFKEVVANWRGFSEPYLKSLWPGLFDDLVEGVEVNSWVDILTAVLSAHNFRGGKSSTGLLFLPEEITLIINKLMDCTRCSMDPYPSSLEEETSCWDWNLDHLHRKDGSVRLVPDETGPFHVAIRESERLFQDIGWLPHAEAIPQFQNINNSCYVTSCVACFCALVSQNCVDSLRAQLDAIDADKPATVFLSLVLSCFEGRVMNGDHVALLQRSFMAYNQAVIDLRLTLYMIAMYNRHLGIPFQGPTLTDLRFSSCSEVLQLHCACS